jgi:stearoyl-CoA desaturase (delta-9 desaturase)
LPATRSFASNVPFAAFHLVPLLAVFTGVTARAVVLGVVLYAVRMFFITAGYHRYFAHRSFKVARVTQFVLAFGGLTAAQKGPLWWAANHRDHHRWADTDRDPHSPQQGFWWSHVGWILSGRYGRVDHARIADFARYPELRFLDRNDWIGPWSLGVLSFLVAGWSGLVVGFFGSTIVLWHATFAVNSFAHMFGRRSYATADTSRNSLAVALLTGGEGWHNNHHHYPASAKQGFRWWQLDATWLVLRMLSFVGLVRGLRRPPDRVRRSAPAGPAAPVVGRPRARDVEPV